MISRNIYMWQRISLISTLWANHPRPSLHYGALGRPCQMISLWSCLQFQISFYHTVWKDEKFTLTSILLFPHCVRHLLVYLYKYWKRTMTLWKSFNFHFRYLIRSSSCLFTGEYGQGFDRFQIPIHQCQCSKPNSSWGNHGQFVKLQLNKNLDKFLSHSVENQTFYSELMFWFLHCVKYLLIYLNIKKNNNFVEIFQFFSGT